MTLKKNLPFSLTVGTLNTTSEAKEIARSILNSVVLNDSVTDSTDIAF